MKKNKQPSLGYTDTVTLCNSVGLMTERRLTDWKKTKRAKVLLAELSIGLGIDKEGESGSGALIEYELGKRAWLHPNLVEPYKLYLSSQAPSVSEFLYLIRAEGTSYYKIGIATNKIKRLVGLQNGCPLELKYVITRRMDNVREVEQLIHRELQLQNVRGEWYNLTSSQVKAIVKAWFK